VLPSADGRSVTSSAEESSGWITAKFDLRGGEKKEKKKSCEMFIFSAESSGGKNEREQAGVGTGGQTGTKSSVGFSPGSVRTAAPAAPSEVVGEHVP